MASETAGSTEFATDTSRIPILLVFEVIVVAVAAVWIIRDTCQSAAAGVDKVDFAYCALSDFN